MGYELLSGKNAKLAKSNGEEFVVTGLSLAPHNLAGAGNVCSHATPGCKGACVLWFSGRTVYELTRNAMKRRTRFLFDDPAGFRAALQRDLDRFRRRADRIGAQGAVRLNVASDLNWFDVAEDNPDLLFYDYTKVYNRAIGEKPTNYQLTYSWNERSQPEYAAELLRRGVNIAAVFSAKWHPQNQDPAKRFGALPKSYALGDVVFPVVDGDFNDIRLRQFDGEGVIVGLRFKGSLKRKAQSLSNGFCLPA